MSFAHCHKTRLATSIIVEHFGDITKDIAQLFMRSESVTLGFAVKYFAGLPPSEKLSARQIRQGMLLLQQHNCLLVELPVEVDVDGDAPLVAADRLKQKGLNYNLNVDMVINRLRFPKVLKISKNLFGDLGVAVMEELILHGRLRLAQIRGDAAIRFRQSLEVTKSPEEVNIPGNQEIVSIEDIEAEIQKVFEKLVQRRLIVPVPSLDIKKRLDERKARAEQALAAITNASLSTTLSKASSRAAPASTGDKQRKRRMPQQEATDSSELPLELRLMLGEQSFSHSIQLNDCICCSSSYNR